MSSESDEHDSNHQLPFDSNDRSPLRHPSFNDEAKILIPLVIIIPIVFVVILCLTTFCIYRYRKKRNAQDTASIDQYNNNVSIIPYNSLQNLTTNEESPPQYNVISETKKDNNNITSQSQDKNETTITPSIHDLNHTDSTNCSDSCCTGISLSPDTACCSTTSWSTLVIPIFVVTGVCLFAVCLIYFRPLCKQCLCRCKCPCGNRTRVTSSPPNTASILAAPVYHINNDDLPDYETISKNPRPKDITPPPYNFVAAHPTDFGIEMSVLNAPPQYRSRCSSVATVVPPLSRVDS
ncbi:unnamed protein product [Adineta steineri]|uniref:Uncharacterized protein n=1 Tax=Adineta steineri TaxID=433720 RepID=A0A813QZB8_9BILA|nr:unnamed protein product [Adineta steineri]CAF1177259.1 unnamed protein product [Adineta steineri]